MLNLLKKILLVSLMISIGIGSALLLGELYFSRFRPQLIFSHIILAYDFHCFEKGDYYYIKFKPNSNCLLKSNDHQFNDVYITTNSLGLRNGEVSSEKKPDYKRILFVGDSYTAGWGVKENEAFPSRVETNLQAKGEKVETINAGLPTAGPGYYYLYLKNDGLKLNPDIVVVGFYLFNDVTDNALNSSWDQVDQAGLPIRIKSLDKYIDINGNFYPKEFLTWPLRIPILRDSNLFIAFTNLFDHTTNDNVKQYLIEPRLCLYKENCHELDPAIAEVKKLFLGMKQLTDQKRVKLVVAIIPSEIQFDRYARIKYGIQAPLLPSDKEHPYQLFISFFKENNIAYIDLRNGFTDESQVKYYFENDDHWNPKGHQAAATELTKDLLPLVLDTSSKTD